LKKQPIYSPHGGTRLGAGRPSNELLTPVRMRLSAADLALAEAIGEGNRTEGVRLALRAFKASKVAQA
jgi:hypothetical protein